jgi:amino acid transporter
VNGRDIKRRILGRPFATHEEAHQLLPKRLALPVFASDPLSSVAYATEESMLVLALAGAGALRLVTPVSLAVAALLLVVVVSYRQTIRAYPNGGGAFIVANDNLGIRVGAVAAASLLTDYVLTVAVSVAAGVAAITSAAPGLIGWRVELSLVFVLLLTFANLRGVKEASTIFALPTYLFVITVLAMLVAGFARCVDGTCPIAISAGAPIEPVVGSVGLFLILRAFASGATALTGVEAIANGVQAFRTPKSENAARTLAVMGVISITMFLGISTLARAFAVRISEGTIDRYGTVISQIGRAAFGDGVGFYFLQVFTAAILVLAANTAYQDFPRLSEILARHRLMPRQFRNRGDRLVFSNGIITLAVLSSVLLVVFEAQVSRLIQLYVVGVFTAFTLSQAGMVRHWVRSREAHWRRSVVINGVGAVVTGLVLGVVAVVKFRHGAWIVLVAIPLFVGGMLGIRRHYLGVAQQLRALPVGATLRPTRMVVLVAHPDERTDRALRYATMVRAAVVTCVHAEEDGSAAFTGAWNATHPDHRLEVISGDRSISGRILDRVRRERDEHPGSTITVVMGDRANNRWVDALSHRHSLAIKARLLFEPGVVVTDLNVLRRSRRTALAPLPIARVEQVVLIADLTRPIREALTYAQSLGTPVTAVHIDTDAEASERVVRHWTSADEYPFPLEVVPSPYRRIVPPLVGYLRERRRRALPGTLICAVIPEFIVPGRLAQVLHNQTGLAIKSALAREAGIAVTSVPFHLTAAWEAETTSPVVAGQPAAVDDAAGIEVSARNAVP